MRSKKTAEQQKRQKATKEHKIRAKLIMVPKVISSVKQLKTIQRTKIFECYLCKIRLPSKSSLRLHMFAHARKKRCLICDTRCTENELRQHFCDPNDKQITCEYCGQVFSSIADCLEHVNAHDVVKKYYKCTRCPKFYAMQRFVDLHEANHMDVINFVCKLCSKVMLTSGAFKMHMRQHVLRASGGDVVITGNCLCDECGKSFKSERNLQLHKQTHSEPNFSCSECPRRFFTQTNLNRHSLTHKDQTFLCGICNTGLTSIKGLKEHMGKFGIHVMLK